MEVLFVLRGEGGSKLWTLEMRVWLWQVGSHAQLEPFTIGSPSKGLKLQTVKETEDEETDHTGLEDRSATW